MITDPNSVPNPAEPFDQFDSNQSTPSPGEVRRVPVRSFECENQHVSKVTQIQNRRPARGCCNKTPTYFVTVQVNFDPMDRMSSSRRHSSPTLLLWWIVVLGAHLPESSLAFFSPPAYLAPSLSRQVNKSHQPQPSDGNNQLFHQVPPPSLFATKCPPDLSALATEVALSNPSYSLQNQNPLPFENPEIGQEDPFQTESKKSDKSTFQSQLHTYQPFWMKKGVVPKAPTPPHQTQPIDPTSQMTSSATSSRATARVSKTFAIPKIDDLFAMPSVDGSSGNNSIRPWDNKNHPVASTGNKEETKSQSPELVIQNNLSHPNASQGIKTQSWHQPSVRPFKSEDPEPVPKNNGTTRQPMSSTDLNASTTTTVGPNKDASNNKDLHANVSDNKTPRSSIQRKWHPEILPTMASTGAKVVETLAKAYAHPTTTPIPSSSSSPPTANESSMTSPSSTSASVVEPTTDRQEPKISNDDDFNRNQDWESRLKALEQAVTSLTSDSSPKKDVVVDTTSALMTPEVPLASSKVISSSPKGDWNLLQTLREQIQALKDTIQDLRRYESKTIHWRIPRIDKHIRLSSSTTFQSDPFYVGSIPFHLELEIQEATGDDEQSVSFFLYHHHWRTRYYRYEQSKYHLWPFQQDPLPSSRQASPKIKVGGSKLQIANHVFVFDESAAIQVGEQDGWGWKHLMSLKELRKHKSRGHLDVDFQLLLEREDHDGRSRVGVAMIA